MFNLLDGCHFGSFKINVKLDQDKQTDAQHEDFIIGFSVYLLEIFGGERLAICDYILNMH
jgi:hypothetical protein